MSNSGKLSKKTKYSILIVVFLLLMVGCMSLEGVFDGEEKEELFVSLANAVTIPSVLFFGLGCISWFSHKGDYHAIGYMFSKFSLHNLLPTRVRTDEDLKENYYDYTVRKNEKHKTWNVEMFLVGAGGLVISILLSVISYFI